MKYIKVDVTENIIGKINSELKFELYYFEEKIGYFESPDKVTFMNDDFSYIEGRILKCIEDVKVSQYAEDCYLG